MLPKFQSLGRDSGCSSLRSVALRRESHRFQSLGRDSGCSSSAAEEKQEQAKDVSIPRSGFWVFKQIRPSRSMRQTMCFNPSVGILGVQASINWWTTSGTRSVSIPRSGFWVFKRASTVSSPLSQSWFQSLGRDSGCSSSAEYSTHPATSLVSIPRSGFWVFKLGSHRRPRRRRHCFNPSVGILGVQATRQAAARTGLSVFQSLGRDSGCSSSSIVEPCIKSV